MEKVLIDPQAEYDFFAIHDNFKEIEAVKSLLMYGDRKENCLVSIMIPTYMRNNLLEYAIESALNQITSVNYEVVVVDNNDNFDDLSTLRIIEKCNSDKISYYKNEKNIGMFGNLNRCLELASGEWVVILHDDDYFETNYVDRMYKCITKIDEVGAIGCDMQVVDENGKTRPKGLVSSMYEHCEKIFRREIAYIELKDMYYWHPVNIVGMLINKQKAIQLGGFDAKWHPISDYVFILNMLDRFGVACLEQTLLNYRIACNETLSYETMIRMVELSALLRDCVGNELSIHHEKYSATYTISEENEKIAGWTSGLTQEEREKLILEFQKFNKQMKYMLDNDKWYFRIYRVLYGLYVRKIRRIKISDNKRIGL